jgi:hypothetical protein
MKTSKSANSLTQEEMKEIISSTNRNPNNDYVVFLTYLENYATMIAPTKSSNNEQLYWSIDTFDFCVKLGVDTTKNCIHYNGNHDLNTQKFDLLVC